MQIALALYPGFTALDIVGPYQVLQPVPGHETFFVAAAPGMVMDGTRGCPLVASRSFDEVDAPDVVVVTGGAVADLDGPLVQWLRRVHATTTWTTSVCTGSMYLAAAGILEGLPATTHWSSVAELEALGATYSTDRVVVQGKVMTSAGVSSGIDMALTLLDRMHGPLVAQAVQLAIEYDPQPPFDSGTPAKASAEVMDLLASTRPTDSAP